MPRTLGISLPFTSLPLLMALAMPSAAQSWAGAIPGARISLRVHDTTLAEPHSQRNALVGLVVAREPSVLLVQLTSHDTLRVPYTSINGATVSRGVSRRESALRWALLEAGLFAILPPPPDHSYYSSAHFVRIAVAGGLGAIAGSALAPERWRRLKP
jgi:hypothetical protein